MEVAENFLDKFDGIGRRRGLGRGGRRSLFWGEAGFSEVETGIPAQAQPKGVYV
jgi:hypothetical protein